MILPINGAYRSEVNRSIQEEWAGPVIVTRGICHDSSDAEGFVSVSDGELTGYVLYQIQNGQCEVLVLHSILENQGIGTALIRAVIDAANRKDCTRVWLITTNDNIHAIRYYQRVGFQLKAVYINALDASRKIKPAIPLYGKEGIPLQHEMEFEWKLS